MKKRKGRELEDLKAQLARALADYDNLRKRVESEKEIFVRYANQGLVERLLPIVRLFDKVKLHLKDQGLDLAIDQLRQIVKEAGVVEIIPVAGEKFDEEKHEAVGTVAVGDNIQLGTIAEVVEKGAVWNDGKLIVPARVRVYGEVSEKEEELKKETLRDGYV